MSLVAAIALVAGAICQTTTVAAQDRRAAANDSIVGRWQLERIDVGKDTPLTPSQPEKYWVEFTEQGTLIALLDCNRGRGGYHVDGATLKVDTILSTLMACGGNSIAGPFTKALQTASGFRRTNDTLVLFTPHDASTLHFTLLP